MSDLQKSKSNNKIMIEGNINSNEEDDSNNEKHAEQTIS